LCSVQYYISFLLASYAIVFFISARKSSNTSFKSSKLEMLTKINSNLWLPYRSVVITSAAFHVGYTGEHCRAHSVYDGRHIRWHGCGKNSPGNF
jgi:hypothetical protein